MHVLKISDQTTRGCATHRLTADDFQLYAAHLLRLSAQDRIRRFAHAMSDSAIEFHVDAAIDGGNLVIGWFDADILRGSCELCPVENDYYGAGLEASFAVEAGYQGRGVGRALIAAALDAATRLSVARIRIDTDPDNVGMLALAERFGAQIWLGDDEVTGIIEADEPAQARAARPLAGVDLLSYGDADRGRTPRA